ncbi:MAG TPA: HlyD family efflux transporter periplasmic adaptor subunit [Anaerolineae bacterium]|nr:HlyD family efflux transporter periplasmic adaptor subunit [Anaerolineae bacterium]
MLKKVIKVGGVLLLALVLVIGGAAVLRRQSQSAAGQAAPAATAEVRRGEIEETVGATGRAAAERQVTLAFTTSGQIVEVLVEAGQEVEAGTVLGRLDTEATEWQVARAEASLKTSEARLLQAQQPASDEEVASAQVALDNALANLARVQEGPSAAELASARAALDSARANYQQVAAGPTKESLAAAQAAVDAATASVQQAQAAYDRVKEQPDVAMRPEAVSLQNATIELERAQANYDAAANHPTPSELAAASAQVAQAESQLSALMDRPAESEISAAEAQVAQAEAQLAAVQERPNAQDVAVFEAQGEEAATALHQAQAALDDAQLVAPFAGTVLTVDAREGEWATPGMPAFTVASTQALVLAVQVDEVDVALLEEGQQAHMSFDAIKGERITGRITRIASASTSVGGAVAFDVEIAFAPVNGTGQALPVRLGMTADVDIVVAHAEDALLIPNQAVEVDRTANRYYVTLPGVDGTSQRVEVEIGMRDEADSQVVSGLAEGDRVILPQVPYGVKESAGFMAGSEERSGLFSGLRR